MLLRLGGLLLPLYLLSFFFLLNISSGKSIKQNTSPSLPSKELNVHIKTESYREAMNRLFSLVDLQFRFKGKIEPEDKVEVKVENLAWDAIFKTLLESYGLSYRFVNPKLLEIYKK